MIVILKSFLGLRENSHYAEENVLILVILKICLDYAIIQITRIGLRELYCSRISHENKTAVYFSEKMSLRGKNTRWNEAVFCREALKKQLIPAVRTGA